MPRNDMTLADKVALLREIDRNPPNTSHRKLAEVTGIPKSTIARMIRRKSEIYRQWGMVEDKIGLSQKRHRKGKNPAVEDALSLWYSSVTKSGEDVTGAMLKMKSEELAKDLGYSDFKATAGWLQRWKARLRFGQISGATNCLDASNAGEWNASMLCDLLKMFPPDDIYNVDETGLYYCATPNGSLVFDHKALASQQALDRVTLLCCANMSGTDKRDVVVIGKSTNPQSFKGMSVTYCFEKNTMMTSGVFNEWLTSWDAELEKKGKYVLLLLGQCPAHCPYEVLKNIRLEFLPPDSTSFVQPMNMGIIKRLKTLYRDRMVSFIMDCIEDGRLTTLSTAEQVSSRFDLLLAAQFLSASWNEISSQTIRNCFTHCGFVVSGSAMPASVCEEDSVFHGGRVENYEEFLCCDNFLECYYENELDSLGPHISAEFQKTSESSSNVSSLNASVDSEVGENNDEDMPGIPAVSHEDARKYIELLRQYFVQSGNEGSPVFALDICCDFVRKQQETSLQE